MKTQGQVTALGALALIIAYAARMEINSLMAVFRQGLVAYFFFLPAVSGASFGFLYAFQAGWDRDDPAVLEAAFANSDESKSKPTTALIDTVTDSYFAGPVRVRTSFILMMLSSLVGGAILFISRALLQLVNEARLLTDHSPSAVLSHSADMSLYAGGEMIFLTLLGLIPITLCVAAGHFTARGFKAKAAWAYFLIGLGTPFALAILTIGLLTVVALMIALPTAIGMACYRAFAGLEPEPVAEDIIVSDPRGLIAADHARRRFGRVVQKQS